MNSNQENKLTMMKAVKSVLDIYQAAWTASIPFSALVADFKAKYNDVESRAVTQAQSTKGATQTKEAIRMLVVSTALEIALTIKAYATAVNNLILKDDFTLTKSALDQLRDTELIIEAQRVSSIATAMALDLAPYDITPLMLSDFLATIADFEAILATPRLKVSQKFIAREDIIVILSQATSTLEDIDGLMLRYQYASPMFYREYRKARKIINLGHRRTRFGLFIELEDGVDYARFSVLLQKGLTSYLAETDADGIASFDSVKAGKYQMTVTKDGYESYSGQVTIKSGVLTTFTVTLNPA